MALPLKIISMGKALPKRKVTFAELDIQLNKKSGFVEKKSGITHRYYVSEQETTVSLAVSAFKEALMTGKLTEGKKVLLLGTVAGLTLAGMILTV